MLIEDVSGVSPSVDEYGPVVVVDVCLFVLFCLSGAMGGAGVFPEVPG